MTPPKHRNHENHEQHTRHRFFTRLYFFHVYNNYELHRVHGHIICNVHHLIRASFLRSRVETREGLMIESALQRLDGRWIDDGLVVRFGQNGTDAVDEYVTQRL